MAWTKIVEEKMEFTAPIEGHRGAYFHKEDIEMLFRDNPNSRAVQFLGVKVYETSKNLPEGRAFNNRVRHDNCLIAVPEHIPIRADGLPTGWNPFDEIWKWLTGDEAIALPCPHWTDNEGGSNLTELDFFRDAHKAAQARDLVL